VPFLRFFPFWITHYRKNRKPRETIFGSLVERWVFIIIMIIERRDDGGVLSEDCEDTEQSSEKVSKVRETVLRTRNCQTRPKLSCRVASSEQFSLQVLY